MVLERWAETRRAAGWGRMCHAVAGELAGLLQDWRLMLAQLEHQLLTGRLTLQARPAWTRVRVGVPWTSPPCAVRCQSCSSAARVARRRCMPSRSATVSTQRCSTLLHTCARAAFSTGLPLPCKTEADLMQGFLWV